MRLQPNESDLKAEWILVEGKVVKDQVTERIDELVKKHLTKVKVDKNGWNSLFQDPSDGRYWELTYPCSEMHGGGPPRLSVISVSDAAEKYKLGQ
jgi:hypothetical protein